MAPPDTTKRLLNNSQKSLLNNTHSVVRPFDPAFENDFAVILLIGVEEGNGLFNQERLEIFDWCL